MDLQIVIPDRIELHGLTVNAIRPYVLRNKKTKARYVAVTYVDQGSEKLMSLFNIASSSYVSHIKYEVKNDIVFQASRTY